MFCSDREEIRERAEEIRVSIHRCRKGGWRKRPALRSLIMLLPVMKMK
ncbi:hypothetical protein [Indiicoccus explosivorum]|nr:hypothetical protein [Indiicoccus explosivorum]